ncbi:MAG: RNA polymerase sigma factor [Lachnospiraceae bacterium]|nr:RNA polymerase sigma factor [Lachnospiraceae bacterium]
MKDADFSRLYESYAEQVYKFLLGLCGDVYQAEDLMQDTFVKAIQSVDGFDNRCKFTTWLYTIAKNTYYDSLRKKKRHPEESLTEDVTSGQSLEACILDDDSTKEIRRMIHRLPEPYKEVFLLRYYGELSFREIGETFEKSEVWGRVTYLRGKELLRTYLSERS